MIDLNKDYEEINAYTRGRKLKKWFIKDGKKYLYKYGASNYEIYAELIAEQLGRQCGINMANYKIAKYKDTTGVLTESFIKPGELIISSDKLKNAVEYIYEENNLEGCLKDNTIKNLIEAAFTYDSTIDVDKLFKKLVKRWMFYGIIMESDKNATNISFIRKRTKLKLSPDYDNSTMCRLNENTKDLISEISNLSDIHNMTKQIQQALKPTSEYSDDFLESFEQFVDKYPEIVKEIYEKVKEIDVYKAINKVESINKIEIPWEVQFYVNKLISTRIKDMEFIINLKQDKNKKYRKV